MKRRSVLNRFLILLTVLLLPAGCGPRKLVRLKTIPGCPWCAPNRQVQVGDRSMGKSFYGDIWRSFWIDASGQEYDPEEVSKQVWGYIATTDLAQSIDAARQQGRPCAQMQIISVDPVVVLLYPSEHQRLQGVGQNLAMGTRVAQELAWTPKTDPIFAEPMQWLSPDLQTGPTDITFSPDGVAEIPLKSGKIKLVHVGERCKITRE